MHESLTAQTANNSSNVDAFTLNHLTSAPIVLQEGCLGPMRHVER